MTDLERRKRALVAEGDVYRETLRHRAHEAGLGLKAAGERTQQYGFWTVGLIIAVPLLAWALRNSPKARGEPAPRMPEPERPPTKASLLTRGVRMWQTYQKYSPLVLMAWRFLRQRANRPVSPRR